MLIFILLKEFSHCIQCHVLHLSLYLLKMKSQQVENYFWYLRNSTHTLKHKLFQLIFCVWKRVKVKKKKRTEQTTKGIGWNRKKIGSLGHSLSSLEPDSRLLFLSLDFTAHPSWESKDRNTSNQKLNIALNSAIKDEHIAPLSGPAPNERRRHFGLIWMPYEGVVERPFIHFSILLCKL